MLSLLHISQMSNIVRVIVVISFFLKKSIKVTLLWISPQQLFNTYAVPWVDYSQRHIEAITTLQTCTTTTAISKASKQAAYSGFFFLSFFFLNTRTMNSFSYYNAHECLQGTKQVRVTGDKFSQQADSCGSNTICAMLKTKKKDRSAFCCFQFSVSCMSGGGVGDFLCSSLTAGLCASSPHTSQAS